MLCVQHFYQEEGRERFGSRSYDIDGYFHNKGKSLTKIREKIVLKIDRFAISV